MGNLSGYTTKDICYLLVVMTILSLSYSVVASFLYTYIYKRNYNNNNSYNIYKTTITDTGLFIYSTSSYFIYTGIKQYTFILSSNRCHFQSLLSHNCLLYFQLTSQLFCILFYNMSNILYINKQQ